MRIIQSLWSKPMLSKKMEKESRFSGGWLDGRYHLMSWTLSCLQLIETYGAVELYTDSIGRELLIEKLKLPYTRVHVVFDRLKWVNPQLWAAGKLYAYNLQDSPFIHIDSDVYIWKKFSDRLEHADLIAQNTEVNFSFYQELFQTICIENFKIPLSVWRSYLNEGAINAYNAGIIGGRKHSFFKLYCQEVFHFLKQNRHKLHLIPIGKFNAFYEQHMYYCISKRSEIKVENYLETHDKNEINRILKGVGLLKSTPSHATFVHLFGEDSKKNIIICLELEDKLLEMYPEWLKKVNQIFNSHILENTN
jgi:hypothetical protein